VRVEVTTETSYFQSIYLRQWTMPKLRGGNRSNYLNDMYFKVYISDSGKYPHLKAGVEVTT